MPSRLWTAAVKGIEATPFAVEVDISPGLGAVTVVGLGDTAVQEAKERVRSALKNSELPFPRCRVTINLAPADVRKEGPSFDLPIALGILAATGGGDEGQEAVIPALPEQWMFCGELGLDGTLRSVEGVIAIALSARRLGYTHLVVPPANATEAALVEGITIVAPETLKALVGHLRGEFVIESTPHSSLEQKIPTTLSVDFSYIHGQESAKRALEIAASGGHNILMTGPPGSGKTLLARSMVSILPPMTHEEMIEVMSIYSVCGLLAQQNMRSAVRPFRSPHHTSSDIALVGGGTHPRPGEITLAHRGVLFLDELPEFARNVLESLRQPLEDGVITVARANGTIQFPARFMLVASANPCPCGFASTGVRACTCSASQVLKYQKKISGPLLDRIDLVIDVPAVETEKLFSSQIPEGVSQSAQIRQRVEHARGVQRQRFIDDGSLTNAEMTNKHLKRD